MTTPCTCSKHVLLHLYTVYFSRWSDQTVHAERTSGPHNLVNTICRRVCVTLPSNLHLQDPLLGTHQFAMQQHKPPPSISAVNELLACKQNPHNHASMLVLNRVNPGTDTQDIEI